MLVEFYVKVRSCFVQHVSHPVIAGKQWLAKIILDSFYPWNPIHKRRNFFIIPMPLIEKLCWLSFASDISGRVVNGKKYSEPIQNVISKIKECEDFNHCPMYVYVTLENDTGASSLPGGYIRVSKNILKELKETAKEHSIPFEDLIAGVMLHELVHVAAYHGPKVIQFFNALPKILFLAVQFFYGHRLLKEEFIEAMLPRSSNSQKKIIAFLFSAATTLIWTLYEKRVCRAQEREADCIAMKYMKRLSYNPKHYLEILNILLKQQLLKENKLTRLMNLFETHPLGEERLRYCQSVLESI